MLWSLRQIPFLPRCKWPTVHVNLNIFTLLQEFKLSVCGVNNGKRCHSARKKMSLLILTNISKQIYVQLLELFTTKLKIVLTFNDLDWGQTVNSCLVGIWGPINTSFLVYLIPKTRRSLLASVVLQDFTINLDTARNFCLYSFGVLAQASLGTGSCCFFFLVLDHYFFLSIFSPVLG